MMISAIQKTAEKSKTLEECYSFIEKLSQQLTLLVGENAVLKERLNVNSKNSSLPLSQDFKKKKKVINRAPG